MKAWKASDGRGRGWRGAGGEGYRTKEKRGVREDDGKEMEKEIENLCVCVCVCALIEAS